MFCSINDEIKRILQNIKSVGSGDAASGLPAKQNLFDLVKQDAEKYVPFSIVLKCLDIILKILKNTKVIPELSDCYTQETQVLDSYDTVPKIDTIATWLHKNKSGIYADVIYDTEVYQERVPKNFLTGLSFASMYGKEDDEHFKTVTKTRRIAKSFNLMVDLPYKALVLTFYASIPNLTNYSFIILPLISRTQLVIFITKLSYVRTSWDDQKIDNNSAKWSYSTFEYVIEDIEKHVNSIIRDNFQNAIKEDLMLRFTPPDEVAKEGEGDKEKLQKEE